MDQSESQLEENDHLKEKMKKTIDQSESQFKGNDHLKEKMEKMDESESQVKENDHLEKIMGNTPARVSIGRIRSSEREDGSVQVTVGRKRSS